MKQGNSNMFENAREESLYDDTIRPVQIQAFRKESYASVESSVSAANRATLKADANLLFSIPPVQEVRETFKPTVVSRIEEGPDWNAYYKSLSPDGLQELVRLVEENEMREIQSIRNEFGPKLVPIIEGIAFLKLQIKR